MTNAVTMRLSSGIMLVPAAIVLAFISLIVATFFFLVPMFFDSQIDHVAARRFSPDLRRVIEIVHRDHGYGLGLVETYGVLRLRRAKGWGLGRWEEVLTMSDEDVERLVELPAWSDDTHVVVTFAADARTSPRRLMAIGVEVDIRRQTSESPAAPP